MGASPDSVSHWDFPGTPTRFTPLRSSPKPRPTVRLSRSSGTPTGPFWQEAAQRSWGTLARQTVELSALWDL